MDSFLAIFDKERSIHWSISYLSQSALLEADILRYQFLHPGVTFGQDLKVCSQLDMAILENL